MNLIAMSDGREVDIDSPRPMEYHAGKEWDAYQRGEAPPPAPGVTYQMPSEYHARQRYLERYQIKQEAAK